MRLLEASESDGGSVIDAAGPEEIVGELVRPAPPSPAGPVAPEELERLPAPPAVGLPAAAQVPWLSLRQCDFVFRQRARFGDVWSARGYVRGGPVVVCHPEHVRSLFSAPPELVPTLAEDLYPDPFAFHPERWLGRKPGTYEWIPFGGGNRRCLGAALAMAEQRVVLREMVRRLDLEADRPEPERPQHRNVTMIPARGGAGRVEAARRMMSSEPMTQGGRSR